MNFPNKRGRQKITLNHSSGIKSKGFIKIYKKYTDEPYSLLVINTTLLSDNPFRFRQMI